MNVYLYIAAMALTTYLIRMLPFSLWRRRIRSPYWRSFLGYMPYAVLAAMTVPGIFYATGSALSAVVGTVVAVALAYFERGLVTVALSACAAAWLTDWLVRIGV